MNKFENVDIFASLDAIMRQNTGFFQSDFDIDKEIIAKAAASPNREDKTLLWFCRPSGTHCFKERDVFLKDTAAHNTWCFYKEQTCDCVLAYAVELTGRERGKIKGNLYELDYARQYERVKDNALAADTVKLIYEHSEFVNSDTCMVYWNFCIPNELVETKGLMLPIMEARDLLKPSGLYYESYLNNFGRQLFYVISGSYTTLYMGFMFLIIACALLALQFLTQMQTTKSRYLTLSILGARREQIKRSINQQVLWYFLLPLILACISGAVGIYAMQLYLYSGAAHLEQSYPLLIAMAVIVVLVMVIYGVAVARTANREIGKLNYKPNS